MEVSDGPNEWDAIMSVQEKEDEIRRLTVSFSCFSSYEDHHWAYMSSDCWDHDQAKASIKIGKSSCCDRRPAVQVPENLPEIQKCLLQLTGGHAIQQMHAIERQCPTFLLSPRLHVLRPSECDRTMGVHEEYLSIHSPKQAAL